MRPTDFNAIGALATAWEKVAKDELASPNACILAARVGAEALRYFGVRVQVEPVSLGVLNAKLFAQMEAGVDPADIDWSDGSWGVGINPDMLPTSTGPGWNGHLVLVVDKTMLMDLTLPQVNRPKFDIVLDPLIAKLDWEGFRRGERQGFSMNGCLVEYRRRSDLSASFRGAPDWTRNHKEFVPTVIARMKGILAEAGSALAESF